jgi:DNA-binding CsgD family transcriptional regulator/tetratricopeptide (TPR) repeat protein
MDAVTANRPLICPILVGRDDLLGTADQNIAEVMAGTGRFTALAGESGIGKTRLLGAIERRARAAGLRSVRGGTYPSDLRVPAAVLLDLGRSMARATDEVTVADGDRLLGVLDALAAAMDASGAATGDAHRRRRLMVLDVVDALAAVADHGPVLVELEDLHWSDDLTLEVLEGLAARIGELPMWLVGTYRSDELYPRLPTREWRARLLGRRMLEELSLERLDPADTATMTSVLMGADLPASRDLVEAIQHRSDGIPLHVEELLALMVATGDRAWDPGADRTRWEAVPTSVEDVIVARIESRSPDAVAVARAGAVIGRSFDLDLLAAVLERPLDDLAEPIVELGDHFILLPTRTPGRYGFRHALICDSIYLRLPEPERRRLHDRTADAAQGRSDFGGLPFLALQLEKAGRVDEAFIAARAGAREATALSSHREARDLYETAVRTTPADLPAIERGALLEALAGAAAATDDNLAADVAYEAARAAYLSGGEVIPAAAILAPQVAVRHLLGDDLATRTARLTAGLDELAALRPLAPPGTDAVVAPMDAADAARYDRARASLLAALSAAYMLARHLDESITYGTVAHHAAEAAGDPATSRNAATTLGACYVFAGRMDDGWAMLEGVIESATAADLEAEVARAYRMLGSCASVLVEYPRAERFLRRGIDHAETAQLWNDRHYMTAHLAHVLWATGRWSAAEDLARHTLADGRGGITTRITALHVLGFVALGRGRLDEAERHLNEALGLSERMGELQRLAPSLWGLAELALAAGRPTVATDLADRAEAASAEVRDAAYLYPFAVTGMRGRLEQGDAAGARAWLERISPAIEARAIPGTLPALDHARGLLALNDGTTGIARTHLVAAVAGWTDRGRAWEGAWARLDLARCHQRANQRTEAAREAAQGRVLGIDLGAPAIVEAADALLGPRSRSRTALDAPWAPLTAREFDVARAVARGGTNPEIAETLGISRKTVAAHVEHILDKLGMGRRTEIGVWVATRPVLHSRPHGDDREK